MGRFSYLKATAHSVIIFLYELTKQKIREIIVLLVTSTKGISSYKREWRIVGKEGE